MRYWDSSALLTLLIEQQSSARLRSAADEDAAIITWWATPAECASALARLAREGRFTAAQHTAAMSRLRTSMPAWTELSPSATVLQHAFRLVRLHPLRAADALQLAAAVVASDFEPGSLDFVTLDTRLAEAAEVEGFRVVG